MTRIGWIVLVVLVVIVGGFAALSRFGSAGPPPVTNAPPQPVAPAVALVVPVAGVAKAALVESWGDLRGGGRPHEGTDIMAPQGTPVLAATDGVVEKLFNSRQGGRTLYLRGPSMATETYYAHLDGYAPGLREGQRVNQGAIIATVGATGNADAAAPHLHFEVHHMAAGQKWWQGEAVDPYPLLVGRR